MALKKKNKISGQDIYRILQERILNGKLSGKLPSTAELSREFKVSHNTVQKVVDQLKLYGLVFGRQGKGVFVSENKPPAQIQGEVIVVVQLLSLQNPFYLHVLGQLRTLLRQHNYAFQIVNSMLELSRQPASMAVLLSMNASEDELSMLIRRFGAERLLSINKHVPGINVIGNDNFAAGKSAIEYLYARGHRKIGIISRDIDFKDSVFDFRYRGIMHFAEAHRDMTITTCNIDTEQFEMKSMQDCAEESTLRILSEMPGMTAIFAFTDVLAAGVLSTLNSRQIRVPEDISLLSYDNRDFSPFLNPPLTTFNESDVMIAQKSFNLISDVLSGNTSEIQTELILPSIVERDSVRSIL